MIDLVITKDLVYDPIYREVWDRSQTTIEGRYMVLDGCLGKLSSGPGVPINIEIAEQWMQLQRWQLKQSSKPRRR